MNLFLKEGFFLLTAQVVLVKLICLTACFKKLELMAILLLRLHPLALLLFY
jgi:hypothetical protein